jgi:glycosyltransferase involved in cell wall biosynthesis
VSDGCVYAKKIYELIYTSNDKIKFVWLDRKASKKMYDFSEQKIFYRGYPKAVGCQHATGDIICYLDSDDIMLPDHLFALNSHWSLAEESIMWGSNNLRVVNTKLLQLELPKERKDIFSYKTVDLSTYGIYEDFFVNICCRYNELSCATYCLSHRKGVDVTWTDTVGINEDITFVKALMSKYPNNLRISSPTMVVCHHRDGWDV